MSPNKRENTGSSADKAPFFVGYKPMPPPLKRFTAVAALTLLLISIGFAYIVARKQLPLGAGSWNTEQAVTIEGILSVDPYPILHRIPPLDDGTASSVLLVMRGKHGADAVARKHAGLAVAVTGFAIRRGGWLMLELSDESAIERLSSTARQGDIPAFESLGAVTLSGEIADSKCFLGVMNPGAGPVHRACAELCLLGGIPPMLVAEDRWRRKFGYLLVQADGSSAAVALASLAAAHVTVSGELIKHGDMLHIRLAENASMAPLASVVRSARVRPHHVQQRLPLSGGPENGGEEVCAHGDMENTIEKHWM